MNKQIRDIAVVAGYGNRWNTTEEFEQFLEQFAEGLLSETINSIYRSNIGDRKQERLVEELVYKFGFGSPVRQRPPVVTITQEEKEALSNWGTLE